MPKLLLINPASDNVVLSNIKATTWPPLNLPYIAAVTPSRYTIEVIDENIEPFRFRQADLVGITAITSSVARAYQLAGVYRKKGIPTVIGGIHASMMPDEALKFVDSVVIGEAETVWPQLIRDFEAGRLEKKYFGQWVDLDRLPLPRRDILKNSFYKWGSIQTSRGCPMDCTFCSVTAFNGRRFRRRPLESVLTELKQIPQRMVLLADDNIIGHGDKDKDWAMKFFREVHALRLKKNFFAQASLQIGEDRKLLALAAKAGLRMVLIGMESVNPDSLRAYKKGINLKLLEHQRYPELIRRIRRSGIAVLGAFVLGGDDDTPKDFAATYDFIRRNRIDVIQTTKPTPLPGTKLWDQLVSEGRIVDMDFPRAWKDYRLSRLVFKPRQMTRKDVYKGFTKLRADYYHPLETFRRTLSTLVTTRNLVTTLLAYRVNASYRKAFYESDHYRRYGR
ncbi:MAG: B12-binding domain-containing radical SAM protein [Desulfosarcina sp.]|nr:B12-binding domain-containing radical SAM protein [Desulfobacterales bacterium]